MKLVQSIMTNNPCYSKGRKLPNGVKGLMLHSVGCPQPKASVFINGWNKASYDRACVHGFIDANDGTVYQTLPWDWRGWHGGGSSNNTHIGVEMCEPACIKYTGGATFTCSDLPTARAAAERTYQAAVELFAMLCKQYGLDPMGDGVILSHKEGCARGIASNHGDPEHLWTQLGMGYTMNTFRAAVKAAMGGSVITGTSTPAGLQAASLDGLSESQVMEKVGPLFTADQKRTGILASVSLAQFLLESGYGKSELAKNANNCFGMKKNLSGNTWSGSTWDGKSVYAKQTKEQNQDGSWQTISADFRKYANVEDSIADHSAYLLGAKNGSNLRYKGLAGEKDYRTAAQIIKNGGYATALTYVDSLCSLIEKWNLTRFDVKETAAVSKVPYTVRVKVADLNIRKGAGTNYAATGKFTGKGVFTIVEEKQGRVDSKGTIGTWGRLKSGAGWICLAFSNYTEKV